MSNDPDYEPEHNCWSCFQMHKIEGKDDVVYCEDRDEVEINPDKVCWRWDG